METNPANKFLLYSVYRAMTGDEVGALLKRHGITGNIAEFILDQFQNYEDNVKYCSGSPDDKGRLSWGWTHQIVWELLAARMGYDVEEMTEASETRVNEIYDLFFTE